MSILSMLVTTRVLHSCIQMTTIEKSISGLEYLTPVQLHDGCKERKPNNSHESYCFEMFRRAIVEKSEHCWALIYQQYERLVCEWIFEIVSDTQMLGAETPGSLVAKTFTNFWRAFDHSKLEKAAAFAPILSYLKSCAVTTVLQAKRAQRSKKPELELDDNGSRESFSSLHSGQQSGQIVEESEFARKLWEIVEGVCRNEQERVVAWLSFVSDCTPDKIRTIHPGMFADSKEISEIRRSLKNRLLRNQDLKNLAEE